MENDETIRKYEFVVIVNANQTSEVKDGIIKSVTEELTKHDVKVISTKVWMEKHKFTFEINKCKEGTYYLMNVESNGSMNDKITRLLKVKENVLRFMISVV